MRGFISVDLEGLPFIVSREHLEIGGKLFDEARSIATELTLCVCEALKQNGVDSVLVADSHGSMVNIIPKLPPYVELLRGYPRATSMIAGAEGCDFAIFLGYHAKGGTEKATFDHAFSGSMVDWIEVNGVKASEYFLNGIALGHYNIPVILVAGDETLMGEVAPEIEKIALKRSLSRYAAISKNLEVIKKELSEGCVRALSRIEEIKPMRIEETAKMKIRTRIRIRIRIRFTSTDSADCAELLPCAKRIDGKTIEFESENIVESYKTIELLILAAYGARG